MPQYPRSPMRKIGELVRTRVRTDSLETIDNSYYGVKWDGAGSACVRTGALTGVAASSSPGNALLPCQATIRRCILNDDSIEQYFMEPDDGYNRLGHSPSITGTEENGDANEVTDTGVFTLAESEYKGKYVHNITTGDYALITAKTSNDVLAIDISIMNIGDTFEICTAGIGYGGDGQVMVKVTAFHYRFSVDGDGYPNWDISTDPFDGSSIHPAFIKNGEFVPFRYYSAYEGSVYDASAGAMVPDADIELPFTVASGDKLCSLSGEYPKTNDTRDEFRILAAMRGTGWRQQDFDLASAIQLLFLVEYADFNSQSMISNGRTMFSGGLWEAANQGNGKYIAKCGYSNGDGNASGGSSRASVVSIVAINTETNTAYHDYMSYRGIENFFGNIWKFVDGININTNVPYVSNDDSDFQDDTATNYIDLGITLPASNNYQLTLHTQDRGFLPATVGANTTKITDYYWQAAGWRVVSIGGIVGLAAQAGAFAFYAISDSTIDSGNIGGRLCL